MNDSLLKKIIIPLVFIGVLGYFGYTLFIRTPVSMEFKVVEMNESGITGEEIVAIIEKLKMLSIDQAVFSSELFMRLRDYGQPLAPELQGRSNPFAPIGSEGQAVSQTSTTTRTR